MAVVYKAVRGKVGSGGGGGDHAGGDDGEG